jgi:mannose-1-phosphate guanylyltransferase
MRVETERGRNFYRRSKYGNTVIFPVRPEADDAHNGHTYVIVLAAGDGLRLRSVTTDGQGRAWPKQYCSFMSEHSLLRCTLQRAERLVPRERILVVVAEHHEPWWRVALADWPEGNVLVQPRNQGTAAGVLFPLLHALNRDVLARVVVLPSDHFVEQEVVLDHWLRRAMDRVASDPARLVLLGFEPDRPETGYGWIVAQPGEDEHISSVGRFVEKPQPDLAQQLHDQGGLWNSFIFAAQGASLLELYCEHLPALPWAFLAPHHERASRWDPERLRRIYDRIEPKDFSKHLLERCTRSQMVLRVPECGWTDLGTPDRVRSCRDAQRRLRRVFTPALAEDRLDISLAC